MPKPDKYNHQRERVTPPHVDLVGLREAAEITIDQLIDRIYVRTGQRYTRGAISAVELGHRGASTELIRALEVAFNLKKAKIAACTYEPRPSRRAAA